MKESQESRLSACVAFVLLAALALAACGGSGTTASTPSPGSGPALPSPSSSVPSIQDLTDQGGSANSTLVVNIPDAGASFAKLKKMYDYDRGEPLAFEPVGATAWGGDETRAIEYTSAGCNVTGALSMPRGKGPFPVVLMAPGTACTASLYESDIPALNRMGIAALAVDSPDRRDPYVDVGQFDKAVPYIEANVRWVVDLRRALDLLETLPRIDSDRIGFVGESWGGSAGALLAGVDRRIKAYVLTYAGGSLKGLDPVLVGEVQDPAEFIAHNRGGSFLFQYTKQDNDDEAFDPKRVAAMLAVTPAPKTFQWVKGGHGMMFRAAGTPGSRFHRAWLKKNL